VRGGPYGFWQPMPLTNSHSRYPILCIRARARRPLVPLACRSWPARRPVSAVAASPGDIYEGETYHRNYPRQCPCHRGTHRAFGSNRHPKRVNELTEADGLCRSGLGELARLASARAQWDCSVVGHLVALAHLLVVAGLVTVGLCVWRGVVSRHQPQPSGHGFPQPPGQGYGVWPSQPPSGPGSPQPPGQGLPQPPRQG